MSRKKTRAEMRGDPRQDQAGRRRGEGPSDPGPACGGRRSPHVIDEHQQHHEPRRASMERMRGASATRVVTVGLGLKFQDGRSRLWRSAGVQTVPPRGLRTPRRLILGDRSRRARPLLDRMRPTSLQSVPVALCPQRRGPPSRIAPVASRPRVSRRRRGGTHKDQPRNGGYQTGQDPTSGREAEGAPQGLPPSRVCRPATGSREPHRRHRNRGAPCSLRRRSPAGPPETGCALEKGAHAVPVSRTPRRGRRHAGRHRCPPASRAPGRASRPAIGVRGGRSRPPPPRRGPASPRDRGASVLS